MTGLSGNTLPLGGFVRNPEHPEWGLGRIQTVTGSRVTVNFENMGRMVLELPHVTLVQVDPDQSS